MTCPSLRRSLSFAWLFATALVAQTDKPAPGQPDISPAATPTMPLPKPIAAWPAISASDRDRALSLAGQLKKDGEELRAQARSTLVGMGSAAAPILFQKVGDADKELELNEELYKVFDEMLGREHRKLMAEQAKKKKLELRKYLLRRLCLMADPEMKSTFDPFRNDADDTVKLLSNLGLAALKDKEALFTVMALTRAAWTDHVDLVKQALPAARSQECGDAIWQHVSNQDSETKAAGLRLMRYVATEAHEPTLKAQLSSQEHVVVKESINALRVLRGMEPLEQLSAFDAIGMAKEWQSK